MHDLEFAQNSASVNELERLGVGRQAEIYAWPQGGVVKLFRSPNDGASARREAASMYALQGAGIPMPQILGTISIEQRPGILVERLEGRDQLSLLGRKPWLIWTTATNLARLHAQLHSIAAPEQLPSLKTSIVEEIEKSDNVPSDCKQRARDVLKRLPDGAAVCHWDFHPGNVIETATGPMVIDWTSVRRGDALADVARTLLILRSGALPPEAPFLTRMLTAIGRTVLCWRYLHEYRRLRPFKDRDLEPWSVVSAVSRLSYGLASEREILLALIRAA